MTTKTAAEQVADERNPLTAAEQMAIALSDAIGHFEWHDLHQPGRVGHILYRDMRAALERWRAEQDSASAELQAVRQQRDALVVAAKAMIADLDMRARMHGDVEDGIAVLDVSSSVLERTYSAIEAASQGGEA